jgi:high affinity sulfate transporter 1
MANVVMSIMVLLVLAVATPLFHYTPNCILASIIMNAVLSLFDYNAMYKIWKVDMPDFMIMIGAFLGVAFYSIEVGLLIAVCIIFYTSPTVTTA